jgi:hypothetical protein
MLRRLRVHWGILIGRLCFSLEHVQFILSVALGGSYAGEVESNNAFPSFTAVHVEL